MGRQSHTRQGAQQPSHCRPMSTVAKRSPISATAELLLHIRWETSKEAGIPRIAVVSSFSVVVKVCCMFRTLYKNSWLRPFCTLLLPSFILVSESHITLTASRPSTNVLMSEIDKVKWCNLDELRYLHRLLADAELERNWQTIQTQCRKIKSVLTKAVVPC